MDRRLTLGEVLSCVWTWQRFGQCGCIGENPFREEADKVLPSRPGTVTMQSQYGAMYRLEKIGNLDQGIRKGVNGSFRLPGGGATL